RTGIVVLQQQRIGLAGAGCVESIALPPTGLLIARQTAPFRRIAPQRVDRTADAASCLIESLDARCTAEPPVQPQRRSRLDAGTACAGDGARDAVLLDQGEQLVFLRLSVAVYLQHGSTEL